MRLVVKTLFGLEDVLAEEIKELGGLEIEKQKRAVAFYGNKRLMYKANLHLRTGLRVLQTIHSFKASNEDELYEKVKAFRWSAYMDVKQTFSVDATVYSKNFTHSKFAALRVKDGIADNFRKEFGVRPDVDTANPDVRFNVHISFKDVIISFDSSGDSLHKRGYRNRTHRAPLNEVLAAGMLKLTGWNADVPLYDPMCGSGTLLIEAGMMGKNIPANKFRKKFGFMTWQNFEPELWEEIKAEGDAGINSKRLKISGSDMSVLAVDIAKESLIHTGLSQDVSLMRRSFERYNPTAKEGIMITNPPYDERIKTSDINLLYKMIGNRLKERWMGYDAWLISSNMEAFKQVGLRADVKQTLYNGSLECEFRKYVMYDDEDEYLDADTIEVVEEETKE